MGKIVIGLVVGAIGRLFITRGATAMAARLTCTAGGRSVASHASRCLFGSRAFIPQAPPSLLRVATNRAGFLGQKVTTKATNYINSYQPHDLASSLANTPLFVDKCMRLMIGII